MLLKWAGGPSQILKFEKYYFEIKNEYCGVVFPSHKMVCDARIQSITISITSSMKPVKGRFWAHPMTTGCLRTLTIRPSSLLEVSELMGVVEVVEEMFSVNVGVRPMAATFLPSYCKECM